MILQYNSANKTSPNTIVAPITHTMSSVPVVVPIQDKLDSQGNVLLNGNVLLGNIVCISKARLGDHIADLSAAEMKHIDKAIAVSLGIKSYYDSLRNEYNDKLQYIEKLKSQRTVIQKELERYKNVLQQYDLASCDALAEFLRNTTEKAQNNSLNQ